MKNSKNGLSVNFLLVVVAIIIVGGGSLAYARNAGYIDLFLSPQEKEQRELKRLKTLFPDQLGDFVLYGNSPEKIWLKNKCVSFPYQSNIELCTKTVLAEYRRVESNEVVFVHLNKVTKGNEAYKELMQKLSRADKLGNYNISRLEQAEIGWFPASQFDSIITQEGRYDLSSGGNGQYHYDQMATGDNQVTQYFLTQFSPQTVAE